MILIFRPYGSLWLKYAVFMTILNEAYRLSCRCDRRSYTSIAVSMIIQKHNIWATLSLYQTRRAGLSTVRDVVSTKAVSWLSRANLKVGGITPNMLDARWQAKWWNIMFTPVIVLRSDHETHGEKHFRSSDAWMFCLYSNICAILCFNFIEVCSSTQHEAEAVALFFAFFFLIVCVNSGVICENSREGRSQWV